MRIYIAGPMRGVPKFNYPAFNKAAEALRAKGHTVFNPAEKDLKKYGKEIEDNSRGSITKAEKEVGFSLREALATDCRWICLHADAVALLPGWAMSRGAKAEKALANALDLEVMYLK